MIVSFNALARAELAAAMTWLAREASPNTASDFNAEVWTAIDRITDRPMLGTPSIRNSRRIAVRRFRYHIIYRIEGESIRVLAVAHQHRRPNYWARRR